MLNLNSLTAKRFAKRLKMAGYNSEERAQPAVCVRLSNLLDALLVIF